jgi:hypothetical protein
MSMTSPSGLLLVEGPSVDVFVPRGPESLVETRLSIQEAPPTANAVDLPIVVTRSVENLGRKEPKLYIPPELRNTDPGIVEGKLSNPCTETITGDAREG